ncbi:hypothetical protein SLS60_008562 [Paraconiothyrium brasiliense]|uniref:F-box domain-containing protein n=1 Tax=Paraconiothyrium brasiliense TaxID=300254 RepID=A0ABR3QXT8_9PLEO
MPLLRLSAELILSIAAYVDQVDLLNLSLVCKHLKGVTEPELYREYTNIHLYNRTFPRFLKRIIRSPDLARNVKKVDLSHWETIDVFNPSFLESGNVIPDSDQKATEFDYARAPEPNEEDYLLYCRAARAAGVITGIAPYETNSRIVDQARPKLSSSPVPDPVWYTHIIKGMSYDQRFCSMLRAGLEDPVIVLMVALLPNVREMVVRGGPTDRLALEWRAPTHRFAKLRRLTVHSIDGVLSWPIAFFNPVLSEGRLEIFEIPEAGADTILPDMVPDLLEPLKETLQELILDLTVTGPDSGDELDERSFIDSLAHLTNRKLLSVTPEMFRGVEWQYFTMDLASERFQREVPDRLPLGPRLPPNLETLVFPLSYWEVGLPLRQLRHIIRTRAIHLPLLKRLCVGAHHEDYLDGLKKLLEQEAEHLHAARGQEELEVSVGAYSTRSAFDDSGILKKSQEELNQIIARYENQGLDEADMTRLLAVDPDLTHWVERNVHDRVEEVIEYEEE